MWPAECRHGCKIRVSDGERGFLADIRPAWSLHHCQMQEQTPQTFSCVAARKNLHALLCIGNSSAERLNDRVDER